MYVHIYSSSRDRESRGKTPWVHTSDFKIQSAHEKNANSERHEKCLHVTASFDWDYGYTTSIRRNLRIHLFAEDLQRLLLAAIRQNLCLQLTRKDLTTAQKSLTNALETLGIRPTVRSRQTRSKRRDAQRKR